MPSLILLVPRVVAGYWSQFPEVRNNAYKYFNYDRRVVEEVVPRGAGCDRGHDMYHGPEDLTDVEFDLLVKNAQTRINPILAKYSMTVACEDALHTAIRDCANGRFDNKVNANRFAVLLKAVMAPAPSLVAPVQAAEVEARRKKEKAPESTRVSPTTLTRQLGLSPSDIPQRARIRKRTQAPTLVREKGQVIIQAKDGNMERLRLTRIASIVEELDVVAAQIEASNPELALAIDRISDRLEGREAGLRDLIEHPILFIKSLFRSSKDTIKELGKKVEREVQKYYPNYDSWDTDVRQAAEALFLSMNPKAVSMAPDDLIRDAKKDPTLAKVDERQIRMGVEKVNEVIQEMLQKIGAIRDRIGKNPSEQVLKQWASKILAASDTASQMQKIKREFPQMASLID